VKISRSVAKITYFLSQKCRIVPFVRKAAGLKLIRLSPQTLSTASHGI